MSIEYEWTDWIEHDGKGCPCRGQWVESVTRDGNRIEHVAGGLRWRGGNNFTVRPNPMVPGSSSSWDWSSVSFSRQVIRYRVRRPRVAEWLQSLETQEPVDA